MDPGAYLSELLVQCQQVRLCALWRHVTGTTTITTIFTRICFEGTELGLYFYILLHQIVNFIGKLLIVYDGDIG